MTHPSLSARRSRVAWRAVLAAGAFLLLLGTHWPNLTMSEGVPGSDKTIHLAAFGGITWLLWRARWTQSRWLTLLFAAAFALLNEWSQGLPLVNRHVSSADAIANLLGVMVAGLWLWALAPVGGPVNRRRLATAQHAWERIFLRWRIWLALLVWVMPCAVIAIWAFLRLPSDSARLVILGSMVAAFMLVHAVIVWAWRRSLAVVRRERRCLCCDAPVPAAPQDADLPDPSFAGGVCILCEQSHARATWAALGAPSLRAMWRAGGLSFTMLLVGCSALLGLILLFPVLHAAALSRGHVPGASSFMRTLMLDSGMSQAVDLALLLSLLAFAVRLYRSRIAAALHDRADRCVTCGHLLLGTPLRGGVGRCGECGQGFLVEHALERR